MKTYNVEVEHKWLIRFYILHADNVSDAIVKMKDYMLDDSVIVRIAETATIIVK